MNNILLAAVMIAANTVNNGMVLQGTGTVFPCLNEKEKPLTTCFYIGTEAWGIENDTENRPIGSKVKVKFHLKKVSSNNGDTFEVFIDSLTGE